LYSYSVEKKCICETDPMKHYSAAQEGDFEPHPQTPSPPGREGKACFGNPSLRAERDLG
jgi:hypothetical protein